MKISAPKITELGSFHLPNYEKIYLDNGIPVSILQSESPDVVKMEIIFQAGRYYEKNRAVAKVTASTLKEGTQSVNSSTIAERIDYLGAYLNTGSDTDIAYVQALFLGRYFKNILEIIKDILTSPGFNEDEISKYKKRQIERLKNDLSKNDILAYRYFTEHLFGEDHPYGYSTLPEDYSRVNREMILEHYNDLYVPNNCKVLLTGNINDDKIRELNQSLGSIPVNKTYSNVSNDKIVKTFPGKFRYENDRMYQTAIRIGKRMFNRHHPDFPAMYLLNTVLGGYFGARLSANIREDKGFTYGIYSTLDMWQRDGYFIINTDVGNEYLDRTIFEIYRELEILRNEPISDDELRLVRNYIKGQLLSMINGNINTLSLIKILELSKLDRDFFTGFVDKISEVTPEELLLIANNHLSADEMSEILVGSYNKN